MWKWGDMIAGVLEKTGAAQPIQRAIETVTGQPCKCKERQAALNRAGEKCKEAVMPSPPPGDQPRLQ